MEISIPPTLLLYLIQLPDFADKGDLAEGDYSPEGDPCEAPLDSYEGDPAEGDCSPEGDPCGAPLDYRVSRPSWQQCLIQAFRY